MQITSRHFGEIELEEEKLLRFPQGIMGFPQATSFCLLHKAEVEPYVWLQSVDVPDLAFLTVPVQLLRPDYALTLRPEERSRLELTSDQTPLLLAIVAVPEDPHQATANLLAPVVINDQARRGEQIVNERDGNNTRHPIREEIKHHAREGKNHVGANQEKTAVLDAW